VTPPLRRGPAELGFRRLVRSAIERDPIGSTTPPSTRVTRMPSTTPSAGKRRPTSAASRPSSSFTGGRSGCAASSWPTGDGRSCILTRRCSCFSAV